MTLRPPEARVPWPTTGSYPARVGNQVRPLIDAVPTFRRICEAIEGARVSVWVAVTFMTPDFALPDGRGTVFDVLEAAARRGIDVRLLVWRPEPAMYGLGKVFPGTAANHAWLEERDSPLTIRWDRAAPGYAQHQKCWLVDAGRDGEVAFVGGINLTQATQNAPGHDGDGQTHDVYVEIQGPAATDVHHALVQRWNEASERDRADGVWPARNSGASLPLPTGVGAIQGESTVQIQRNVHAGLYRSAAASPGGTPWPLADGEFTLTAQIDMAIDAAQRSIFIETQALPVVALMRRLLAALDRGVMVTLVMPGAPEAWVPEARAQSPVPEVFCLLAELGSRPGFLMAGLAGLGGDGTRQDVYVHSKVMIVDETWLTIGSCNLHHHSLTGNSELNASIWDGEVARQFRIDLLAEHLGEDTSTLDDRAAHARFAEIAHANRDRWAQSDMAWQGIAFAIDPARYGNDPDRAWVHATNDQGTGAEPTR